MIRRYTLVIVGLFSLFRLFGQQDPQYSQYLFNGVVINPAYAGSKGYTNLNALYRKQWAGMNRTPTSQTLSIDGNFRNSHSSWGAFFINDQLGYQRTSSLYGTYAYRTSLTKKAKLALGVSAGLVNHRLEGENLVTNQPGDPAIPSHTISLWTPDAQLGLYFNTSRFFAGISMSDIISSIVIKNPYISKPARHYYLSSGLAVPLSGSFTLRPSLLIKDDFKAPANADLSTFLIYKNIVWLGGSYRTRLFQTQKLKQPLHLLATDAVVLQIQIFPTQQLRIGYGYDFTTTVFSRYPTHEISVGYYFLSPMQSGMMTPRYF